ncbi:MAG: hypothetical protein RML72_00265 [Bacteroidia bacterium]|nr:hypothetical protein [Bacteroidia bacterium]MDW8157302.1 hypothetical protein [Bacteroidia bacterium]
MKCSNLKKHFIRLSLSICVLIIQGCQQEKSNFYEATTTNQETLREGEYTDTLANGKLIRKAIYKGGRLWEIIEQKDSSGKNLESGSFQKGNGILNIYAPTGKLYARQSMQGGVAHGNTEILDTAGNTIAILEYHHGVLSQAQIIGSHIEKDGKTKNVNFDTKETDKIILQFKAGNSNALYQSLLGEFKKQENPTTFKKYLDFLKELYGELKEYKMETYNLVKHAQLGEGAEVLYLCRFAYCRGAIAMKFFRENDQFKLADFSIQAEPYTPIIQITRIGNPIMENLKAGNYNEIYNNASERFKNTTPKNQFDATIEKLRQLGNITSFQLYQHQVGLAQGKIVVVMIYEVNIGTKENYFEISMTEQSNNKFILEGIQLLK